MPVFDLYSKRQKRLRGEVPDVYKYDDIPKEFRVQVIHIWEDAIGNIRETGEGMDAYKYFNKTLCRGYGLMVLCTKPLVEMFI
jgi:hypothetical protein